MFTLASLRVLQYCLTHAALQHRRIATTTHACMSKMKMFEKRYALDSRLLC